MHHCWPNAFILASWTRNLLLHHKRQFCGHILRVDLLPTSTRCPKSRKRSGWLSIVPRHPAAPHRHLHSIAGVQELSGHLPVMPRNNRSCAWGCSATAGTRSSKQLYEI